MDSSSQLTICYIIYIKLTALSIKTIYRTLIPLVLQISLVIKDAIIKFSM